MSGEHFDSGAVLARARPVLTFASAVSEGSVAQQGGVRARLETPTPGAVTIDEPPRAPRRAPRPPPLPVIARIVRRPTVRDRLWSDPAARVGRVLQATGVGALLVGALALGTLGVIAGLGMRSLSDEATLASTPPPASAAMADATATERLLARAPLAPRVDHVAPTLRVEAAARTPPAAAHPLVPATTPHVVPKAFAAAHAAHAAAKRASSSTAMARR